MSSLLSGGPSEEDNHRCSPSPNFFTFTLKTWPVVAAVTIGLCGLTTVVAGWLGIELKEQANVDLVRQMFARAFESWKLFGVVSLNVALILVICPVVEEFIFRWGLFKGLKRLWDRTCRTCRTCRTPPPVQDSPAPIQESPTAVHLHLSPSPLLWTFATLSSLLFSAAHYLTQPWPDNAFVALFFFGLAQCWLYRKTDSIWCAILNHALFNLTNLVLMFFVKP